MADIELKHSDVDDSSDQHPLPTRDAQFKLEQTIESGSVVAHSVHGVGSSQGLQKNFNFISLAGTGLVVGIMWPALAGSLLASITNGGAPGVIYEFIAVSVCYFNIAAVIAELASAMPSAAGVLLWASVTAGRRCGRLVGYFAGYWNCLAWIFAEASMSCIAGNLCVQMYAHYHPQFVVESWHVLVCYLLVTWSSCAIVCLMNSILPHLNIVGLATILLGAIITIIVCATAVSKGAGPASTERVWVDWTADIGYPAGFVFISGMLNGAFANGTPDATSHLAEEIPHPEINVPKAIAAQYVMGFLSAFPFLITILYSITDYDALFASPFPIAEVYSQATQGSKGLTVFLLVLLLLPTLVCTVSLYVTCGRTMWTLARVHATPFSSHIGRVNEKHHMPLAATLVSAVLVTVLGFIYLGSSTAFNSFVASFILHSSSSYIAAVLPYLFRRGNPGFQHGPFRMRGVLGWLIHGWATGYMIVWFVVYCFPYALPTDAQSMNYSALIWAALTILTGVWWVVAARRRCLWPVSIEHELHGNN